MLPSATHPNPESPHFPIFASHSARYMNKQTLIDFIQANIPNIPIQADALQQIAGRFEEKSLAKGEYLFRQGEVSGYYFLAEGFLRVFTLDLEGKEVTTYFYSPRRVVFDAASFFQRLPSTENIQAMAPSKVFAIRFEGLNKMFHSMPEFREFGRQMIVQEFVAYKQRTLAMINESAETRYANLLKTNREVFQHAQLSQIASYLGISERTLNRIRQADSRK